LEVQSDDADVTTASCSKSGQTEQYEVDRTKISRTVVGDL